MSHLNGCQSAYGMAGWVVFFQNLSTIMEYVFLGVVIFLFALSTFDLFVGVSNDAVNFLSSAIGSKVARFNTILIVAAVGIFVGATTSNGMMDIARHGIFRPEFFSFAEVMFIFLAVVASDIILLDIFNTLGLPTSTTVSMVFELLGGSTALALIKMGKNGYTYAELINTDKALTVILAIFLSVAIAFVFGAVVQWLSRLVFTFHYTRHLRYTIGLFGGLSVTAIAYFLLIKGLESASFMTDEVRCWIGVHTRLLLFCFMVGFTVLMQVLHWFGVNVFKVVVLFGTFSLAMAFAGNDLVNFIGVTLAGYSSYVDFIGVPGADAGTHMMGVLNEPSDTSPLFLIGAGVIMTVSLMTSKKAQNVVKTSVDLSRQAGGDEMFGSSRFARRLVRSVINMHDFVSGHIPVRVNKWIDSRFNRDEAIILPGAAFDLVRASVNLVLAGLLIVMGTSLKLPLSTTYVAFMVGMGSSLADRAWGRESAVFRVTGVISVIGGWFMTAGAAFFLCFIVTAVLRFGGVPAMVLLILFVVFMLIKNNRSYKKRVAATQRDDLFNQMVQTDDSDLAWTLLNRHISVNQSKLTHFISESYLSITDGLINEDVKLLRRTQNRLDNEKKNWKVVRRKELMGLRKINPLLVVEKDTWFHLACNSCEQSIYCLKRMCEPVLEHVDNNFNPLPNEYAAEFVPIREGIERLIDEITGMIERSNYDAALHIRQYGGELKARLSAMRKVQQERIMKADPDSMKIEYLYMSMLQESQELISHMRHWVRACRRFQQEKGVATVL